MQNAATGTHCRWTAITGGGAKSGRDYEARHYESIRGPERTPNDRQWQWWQCLPTCWLAQCQRRGVPVAESTSPYIRTFPLIISSLAGPLSNPNCKFYLRSSDWMLLEDSRIAQRPWRRADSRIIPFSSEENNGSVGGRSEKPPADAKSYVAQWSTHANGDRPSAHTGKKLAYSVPQMARTRTLLQQHYQVCPRSHFLHLNSFLVQWKKREEIWGDR